MQNYNNNLAYDFDLFAPKEHKAKVIELENTKNVLRSTGEASRVVKSHSAKQAISVVCVVLIVLGFIFFQLYSELVNSELTAEITQAQKTITELKSEQTRLQMEFENIIAYNNIEAAAKELGMQKQETAQTIYVNAGEDDTAVIIDDGGNNGIFSVFADWF